MYILPNLFVTSLPTHTLSSETKIKYSVTLSGNISLSNIDAAKEAGRIGIMDSHAASYCNDSIGIQKNYAAVSCAMDLYEEKGCIDGSVLDEVRRDHAARSKKN